MSAPFHLDERTLTVDGEPHTYSVLSHPGSVAVFAVQEGRICLIRQFRPAADEPLWEIPAGTREEGERPEDCARRELEEEAGVVAKELERLGEFFLAPGYSTELMHVFLAFNLAAGHVHRDPGEVIDRVEWVPLDTFRSMIRRGEVRDAKTLAAFALFERRPQSPPA
ncbi:NUDIX hydrolase [Limnochorda pilosa]|uniref:NUDIX hydrolase n=1 Tax=Limnochorda pilosa TaxID=1555112 RepID=UPI00082D7870|nr:NUDIX hydrolase [Limnochorda pilosa]